MGNVEGYTVVYRRAEDVILDEVPAITGCFSDGITLEEARERVRDAILNSLDEFKEFGEEITSDVLYVERVRPVQEPKPAAARWPSRLPPHRSIGELGDRELARSLGRADFCTT